MLRGKTLYIYMAILLMGSAAITHGQTHRFNSSDAQVVDIDPNDGFDFTGEYNGGFSVKVATPTNSQLTSNEIVDGGSRTTYFGAKITDLALSTDGGTVDVLDSVVLGDIVFWDRPDFQQHVLELHFQVGTTSIDIEIVASQRDYEFGQLFTVRTPNPNTGGLVLREYLTKADGEVFYTEPTVTISAGANEFGGTGSVVGCPQELLREVILADVNLDGDPNLLDVAPFVQLLFDGVYQAEADING